MSPPLQLEMAILNLALNGRDAMPEGGVLSIATANLAQPDQKPKTAPELSPGEYLIVAVADHGHGMPEEVRARAFDPFFTTKDTGKGSGLGLAMVFAMARDAGGGVAIDSAPGQGTVVRLYLRRAPGVDRVAPAVLAPAPDAAAGLRVLLVEDEPALLHLAEALLAEAGHQAIAVGSGAEALARLDAGEPIDLLLTDHAMPGMTGTELAEAARRRRPALPVLLMTGYGEAETVLAWKAAGGSVLAKPFGADELQQAIAALRLLPQPLET